MNNNQLIIIVIAIIGLPIWSILFAALLIGIVAFFLGIYEFIKIPFTKYYIKKKKEEDEKINKEILDKINLWISKRRDL